MKFMNLDKNFMYIRGDKMKNTVLIKTPEKETSLEYACEKEYLKINSLMSTIEREFGVSLKDYPNLRHEILDISNFIKRLPTTVSESF